MQARRNRAQSNGGEIDRVVLVCVIALVMIGVVMVASASFAIAASQGSDELHYLKRHLVFLTLGVVGGVLISRLSLEQLETMSPALIFLAFIGLLLVFLPGVGHSVNGSQRWINLGISKFQVVEAVKLLLVLYLSGYMVRHHDALKKRMWSLVKPLMLALGLALILLMQPDYGSAVLILVVTVGMVWLGGARLRNILGISVLLVPMVASAAFLQPYRIRRLTSFMDPWSDPFADGFQLTQALIALGRGEWTGVGLGASVQKLFYLPEAHTDFILAVIAEETGFLGVATIVGLFFVLVARILWLGARALDQGMAFSGYVLYGVGLWIGIQSLVSMGVNLGVLPTKGITLPLISSGGSSLLVLSMALALVLKVSAELEPIHGKSARGAIA